VKKAYIWIVPLFLAILFTVYHIFGNSNPQKEGVKNKMKSQHIRKSVIAGSWYADDADKLREQINQFYENAKIAEIPGDIIALVAPHAGYVYSGFTAAHSYKQIIGKSYDVVIVVAPSHRESFSGASIYAEGGFETPLGIVPVNESVAKAIISQDTQIRSSMDGHREEHSLEIQLPFLQIAIQNLKIVPISLWDYSPENCQRLATAITNAVKGKKVLLVASTDLYHGYSYDECLATDEYTINKILAMKPKELNEAIIKNEAQACGGGPVVVAEMVAKNLGADKAKMLFRTNSGDVTEQRGNYVVGYVAIAIYKEDKKQATKKVGVDLGLTENDKHALLKIARESIEYGVKRKNPPALKETSPILNDQRGAFVTLTVGGRLRGCIGYIYPIKPLALTVQEMAAAAAFRDPRFSPVQKSELADLEIEISVLTPLVEIKNINEIEIGKHGIIIEKGGQNGLLLPQVASEYGWDRETFLEHTCKKAGLPDDAWKDQHTTIKIFSAEIFHEEK